MSAQLDIAGGVGDEIFEDARAVAGLDRDAFRQAADRPRRHEREESDRRRAVGLPHMSSATMARRNGSPATASDGQIAFQLAAGPATSVEAGLLGQLAELVGREGVDRGLELDALLDIGLQAKAGRALPAVAETYGQRIAGAQIAAADADEQRVRVWPDVEAVEPDFELGAVARLDGGEVRRRRLVELRLAHVGGRPP